MVITIRHSMKIKLGLGLHGAALHVQKDVERASDSFELHSEVQAIVQFHMENSKLDT